MPTEIIALKARPEMMPRASVLLACLAVFIVVLFADFSLLNAFFAASSTDAKATTMWALLYACVASPPVLCAALFFTIREFFRPTKLYHLWFVLFVFSIVVSACYDLIYNHIGSWVLSWIAQRSALTWFRTFFGAWAAGYAKPALLVFFPMAPLLLATAILTPVKINFERYDEAKWVLCLLASVSAVFVSLVFLFALAKKSGQWEVHGVWYTLPFVICSYLFFMSCKLLFKVIKNDGSVWDGPFRSLLKMVLLSPIALILFLAPVLLLDSNGSIHELDRFFSLLTDFISSAADKLLSLF